MAVLLPWIKQQFFDLNGSPLSGGKIEVYLAGTSTPKAVFADRDGVIPLPNPVILDSSGECEIWLKPGSYKFVIKDKNDVVVKTIDRVAPADGGGGGIKDDDYTIDAWSLHYNKQFTATGLMDWLTKLVEPGYQPQTVSLSGSSNSLREKGTVVSSIDLTASVVRKSDPIEELRFFEGVTLLSTQTSGGAIPNGGSSTFNYSVPFSDTKTFSVQVDDTGATGGPSTVTASTTYPFVYPYYVGAGSAGLGAGVSALTKRIIQSTSSRVETIAVNGSQKMYFAYPASYGALTKIFDINNFDTFGDWTRTTVNITGLDGNAVSYYVYEFNNYAVAGSYQYTFVR